MIENNIFSILSHMETEEALDKEGIHCFPVRPFNNEGVAQILTTEAFLEILEPYLEDAPEAFLTDAKERTLEIIEIHRAKYGEDDPRLNNLRRKINRLLSDRQKQQGTVPIPNTLIRNTFYGDKLIKTWEELGAIEIKGEPVIAENTSKLLSSRTAGYILDAVGSYVKTYYHNGENPNMTLDSNGKYYVISDTFGEFCKKADITGDTRRLVKEALFPPEGKAGILERVKFIIPPTDGKKKTSLEIRFISARLTLKQSNEKLKYLNKGQEDKQENDETILAFEMDVHAGVYDFLSHREELLAGKSVKLQDGFQEIPSFLNSKIERHLKTLQKINGEFYGTVLRGNLDKYRQAIAYCINKWNTGKENRKSDLVLKWEDFFKDLDRWPAHTKDKARRSEELETLKIILNNMIRSKEALEGCENVEKTKPLLALVFHLK